MLEGRPTTREAFLRLGLGVAAIVALVLGFVGYEKFLPAENVTAGETWTDVLYYTLQLFLLDSAPLQQASHLPVVLEIARFLAPATTALTLGVTVKAVYDSTFHAVRARRLHDHTIVCGEGTPALLVAREVAAEGRTCVVIGTPGGSGGSAPSEHDQAVLRIAGDPRDVTTLREAHVDRAREVVVTGSSTTRNTDVAAALRSALADVGEPPRCFLEMASPELAIALAAYELNSGSPLQIEFFDPSKRAARRLVDSRLPGPGQGALLVVGDGELFAAIQDELRHRAVEHGSTVAWQALPLERMTEHELGDALAVAVVAVDDDARAVRDGLRMLRHLHDRVVDIVVTTRSSTALGSSISGEDLAASTMGLARLHLFNVTDHVYALDSLRDALYLDMARAAHDAYVVAARARGESAHDNPATVPWEQLPHDLVLANVEQARSIGTKLRSAHLAVVPSDGSASSFAFRGNEVDRLARDEHERWCRQKQRAGWTHGPRDDVAKTHPDLRPWSELTPLSQQKDRDAVEAIPDQLRRVGLQILRARS